MCIRDRNFLVRYEAIQKIGKKAVLNHPPPLTIGGVGGITTESPYGEYIVKLPLHDDEAEATFVGACLEKITQTFPQYPLQGAVEQDIRAAFIANGGQVENLPKLPKTVGGDVDTQDTSDQGIVGPESDECKIVDSTMGDHVFKDCKFNQ